MSQSSGKRRRFLYGPNRALVLRYDYAIGDADSNPRQVTIMAGPVR